MRGPRPAPLFPWTLISNGPTLRPQMGRIVSPKTQARGLAARQRATRVITLLAEGKSQRHVAREVGVTQPRVCQILKAALRELRHDATDRLILYRARQLTEIEGLKAA